MTATLTTEKYDEVIEALKDVMDPELGINIVDLGLIYDLAWDDENDALVIHMTLTSAGCPLTDVLEEQTAQSLDEVVDRFRINWVWMPPWGPERITDDGRDMMRALGFAIRRAQPSSKGGRRLSTNDVCLSHAIARRRTPASSRFFPITWMPIGRPDRLNPAGIATAGAPSRVAIDVTSIHRWYDDISTPSIASGQFIAPGPATVKGKIWAVGRAT